MGLPSWNLVSVGLTSSLRTVRRGSFSAALFGGLEAEAGADIAEVEGVGVESPEGKGFSGPLGEDNEAVDDGEEFVEQEFTVDRFGPGLDFGELEEVVLGSHRSVFSFSFDREYGGGSGTKTVLGRKIFG